MTSILMPYGFANGVITNFSGNLQKNSEMLFFWKSHDRAYCYALMCCQIGISPGMTAAYLGHHYAGPGNHFCECTTFTLALLA